MAAHNGEAVRSRQRGNVADAADGPFVSRARQRSFQAALIANTRESPVLANLIAVYRVHNPLNDAGDKSAVAAARDQRADGKAKGLVVGAR